MNAMVNLTLHFPELDRSIPVREGDSVFQNARRHGVRIVGACGGRGTCGSCMVRITDGRLHTQSGDADSAPSPKKWLRACQIQVQSDCTLQVAPRSLAPVVRAEADAQGIEHLPLDSRLRRHTVAFAPASLADPRADVERLRAALPLGVNICRWDLHALRTLPALLRAQVAAGDARVQLTLRGDEVIACSAPSAPGAPSVNARLLGLAVDLGTTNVAGFLLDLESGERLASLGLENPQAAWGADLISRVNHAIREADGASELQAAALRALDAIAHDLCQAVDAKAVDIVDVALCGNTAMQHLLLGLPVAQLGRAPFVPAVGQALDIPVRDLGLQVCPGAALHVSASVGGFVGGDHVTALLATRDMWQKKGKDKGCSLVMDIGTNTEISLINCGRIFSASSPSGPALEGGHISHGMRAAEGAIERVRWTGEGLAVEVIGQVDAVGLCGSGVLDTLAAMLTGGLVDKGGRLLPGHPHVSQFEGKRAVQLAPGVFFTQDDVRAVQLAKSAIRTVTELLLRLADLQATDIDHFIIAGSFGAYISVESAVAIGLLPDLPRERFAQVGNAAGLGVRQLLASDAARQQAAQIAAQCEYQELSSRADFQKTFLNYLHFPAPRSAERELA